MPTRIVNTTNSTAQDIFVKIAAPAFSLQGKGMNTKNKKQIFALSAPAVILAAFIVLTVLQPAFCLAQSLQDRWIVRITLSEYLEMAGRHEDWFGDIFDVVGRSQEDQTVDVLTEADGLEALEARFGTMRIVMTPGEINDRDIDPQYLNYDELEGLLTDYAADYPDITELHDLGTTHENRTIWGIKISDNAETIEDEPSILIMGLHHAREIMSTEIAVDVVEQLTGYYGSDPDVDRWVEELQIWVVPMVNPDGSAYCWSDDMWWTKNRRENIDGSYGVDLDHNYPFQWGECFGSSSDPESAGYRGPEPGSEPEVQAIMNLASQYRFILALSYHSFDELLIMPYGCSFQYVPDRFALQNYGNRIAQEIRKENGYYGYDAGVWWEILYPTDGVETDWFYGEWGTFCYQIEVNAESYYPPYSLRDETVERNRPGWQKMLDLALDGSMITGHIFDECTGEPLSAAYSVEEITLENGEKERMSDPLFGSFYYPALPLAYHLCVSAEGYAERIRFVSLSDEPLSVELGIVPLDEFGLLYETNTVYDQEGDDDRTLDPGETANLMVAVRSPGYGLSGISALLTSDDSYIDIITDTAYVGDLFGGQLGWTLDTGFRIHASPYTPDNHIADFNLFLSSDQPLCDDVEHFELKICSYVDVCPLYEESLDSNPQWDIENTGEGGWEFGIPATGPPGPYTGNFVYGTNLTGHYGDNGFYQLTSDPFDCSELSQTELRFMRWLHNEENYDEAYVQVSADGSNFITVYEGYESDAQWMDMRYDIASVADGEDSVYVRFILDTDVSINWEGFYIDDLKICGRFEGQVPPTFIPTESPMPTFSTRTPTPTPTSSPTLSPTETCSPPPTATPTVTSSPTLSPTPSSTPTRSPTRTVTRTPTATSSPTLTATPSGTPEMSPTPAEFFLTDIQLSQNLFHAGDMFILNLEIKRNGPAVDVMIFIILDVWNDYFFWPGWTPEADWQEEHIYHGYSDMTNILSFIWPDDAGAAQGLRFWAGCVNQADNDLIGNIDFEDFSYE